MAKEGSVAPKERVNIVYKPATGDAQEEVELPLKMLMIGDFTQRPDPRPLEDRKPINVDKDNFSKVMAEQKKKTAVTFTWKYAAGEESINGFKEAFEQGGGKVMKELYLPFPQVEFQSYLTEIAALKPDVVYVFFAGGGAVKFVKDYAAAGLGKTIQLVGPGFLTDGTLEAQGDAAQGLLTTLHYGDGLDNPKNKAYRAAYAKAYKLEPDAYSVQGYDAAQLLIVGLNAVNGDTSKRDAIVRAMEGAAIASPRGALTLGRSHNPVHDMYLRKVDGKEKGDVAIGDTFADKHTKSLVIKVGGSSPGVESCPGYEPPFDWDWKYEKPTCTALTGDSWRGPGREPSHRRWGSETIRFVPKGESQRPFNRSTSASKTAG